jgi:rhodanese-related sulfurtransferase
MTLFFIFSIIIILFILYKVINPTNYTQKSNNFTNSPLYIDIETARNTPFNIYIDVRTNFEYRTSGFYAKAINIPFSNLHNIDNIIPHKLTSILIYCNSGARAHKAAHLLHNMGYKNVKYINKPFTYLL